MRLRLVGGSNGCSRLVRMVELRDRWLLGAVRVSSVRVNCPSDIMALGRPIVIVSNITTALIFITVFTVQFQMVAIESVSWPFPGH